MPDRILLTAPASGGGKTLITCGMLRALQKMGKKPVSFKCGPDYIDPMFHERVLGTKSRNLDTFFTLDETVRQLLVEHAAGYDIAVLEGVMGYYDGVAGTSVKASASDIARATDTPAILIVNAKGASLSLIPLIRGFLDYRSEDAAANDTDTNRICGVIFNRMSAMLYPRMKALADRQLPVPVVGYVPELPDCVIESRHLGLVMPEEISGLKEKIDHLADTLLETLEWETIFEIAASAPDLPGEVENDPCGGNDVGKNPVLEKETFRIAVARDEAFCFFYEDNLKLLRKLGADLVFFSPLHDAALPQEISGLLLYGGYPELYAKELSENVSMLRSIREHMDPGLSHRKDTDLRCRKDPVLLNRKESEPPCVKEPGFSHREESNIPCGRDPDFQNKRESLWVHGIPCMAECGGFMYLHEQMEDTEGTPWPMAGVIPGYVRKTEKLGRFGYITLSGGTVFGRDVGKIPSHEFHYFDSDCCGNAFLAQKPESSRSWRCIHSTDTLFAGFPHLYYYANPGAAEAFVSACRNFRDSVRPQRNDG